MLKGYPSTMQCPLITATQFQSRDVSWHSLCVQRDSALFLPEYNHHGFFFHLAVSHMPAFLIQHVTISVQKCASENAAKMTHLHLKHLLLIGGNGSRLLSSVILDLHCSGWCLLGTVFKRHRGKIMSLSRLHRHLQYDGRTHFEG